MNAIIEHTREKNSFLAISSIIDFHHPSIQVLARELFHGCKSQSEVVKKCYEWVRDEIKHSYDFKMNPVTCKASDVLLYKTGYCYAKSHLLAALLRANTIPVGFCYQRLRSENPKKPFCLHGLNTVHLEEYGWYRIDARGNKQGIDAQYSPPIEKLAFQTNGESIVDIQDIFSEPLDVVVEKLTTYANYEELFNDLPDMVLY